MLIPLYESKYFVQSMWNVQVGQIRVSQVKVLTGVKCIDWTFIVSKQKAKTKVQLCLPFLSFFVFDSEPKWQCLTPLCYLYYLVPVYKQFPSVWYVDRCNIYYGCHPCLTKRPIDLVIGGCKRYITFFEELLPFSALEWAASNFYQ